MSEENITAYNMSVENLTLFFSQYLVMFDLNLAASLAQLLLVLFTTIFNSLIIIMTALKPHKTIFDKILIVHCCDNAINGLFGLPFFHIKTLFGYWPLGNLPGLIWISYEYSRWSFMNLHMLYLTWTRFKSITSPRLYENTLLTRNPTIVCIFACLISFVIWIPVCFAYGIDSFSVTVKFNPAQIKSVLVFIMVLTPLGFIKFLHIYIMLILKKRNRNSLNHILVLNNSIKLYHVGNQQMKQISMNLKRKMKNFLSGPQIRFQCIITFYWFQWILPCLFAFVNPIFNCIPSSLESSIYWLTYTVCLTDPIIILLLNPNVTFNSLNRIMQKISRIKPN